VALEPAVTVLAGRYELGKVIGAGGMADVHEGLDQLLGRQVAIKVPHFSLARDPQFGERFTREAKLAGRLNHPSIVRVYDIDEADLPNPGGGTTHVPFIVMERVVGHPLGELMPNAQALPTDQALSITADVLAALEFSHQAGIVHRDIKPGNVMITRAGTVKVMDFGIARTVAETGTTKTEGVIGTAAYLSPEQALGQRVDARSDLYSAGCLLFEMLTGRPPFVTDSAVATAFAHVNDPAPRPSSLNPRVPAVLDQVLAKALAKDRADRYQDASAFRADLDHVRRDPGTAPPGLPHARPGAPAPVAADPAATSVLPPVGAPTTVMAPTAAVAMPYVATPYVVATLPPGVPPPWAATPPRRKRRSAAPVVAVFALVVVLVAVAAVGQVQRWWPWTAEAASTPTGPPPPATTTLTPPPVVSATPTATETPTDPPGPMYGSCSSYAPQADPDGLPDGWLNNIDTVTASSWYPPTGPNTYDPGNLFDGLLTTAWNEGAPGDGVGEWIEVQFSEPVLISAVGIANGYQKDAGTFVHNGRPTCVELTFSGPSSPVVRQGLASSFGSFELITVPHDYQRATTSLRITILSVEPGEKYHDTAVSELNIRGSLE